MINNLYVFSLALVLFSTQAFAQNYAGNLNQQSGGTAYGSNLSQAYGSSKVDTNRYGASLFSSKATPLRGIDPNPDYQLAPGDKVDIKTYGAINYQQLSEIDADGNVFLPDVGPVKLGGVQQSKVNSVVSTSVGNIYKDNVKVYTNLAGTHHISVFVTGEVVSPGRYLGDSRFSLIDYINQAGGVDQIRGSLRDVQILRNNTKLVDIDIYEFLKHGTMPQFTLKEGDTILVKPRGNVIEVDGSTDNKFLFEFPIDKIITGADLTKYAVPYPQTTNVIITGTRDSQPFRDHRSFEQFQSTSLHNGDKVTFVGASFSEKIAISISGMHKSANNMVIPVDAKLSEVLDNIAIHPELSDAKAIFIRRKSVAIKQKQAIQESLKKLQESILLAKTSGVTQGSSITEGDAKVLDVLIERAMQVQPEGRLILGGSADSNNLSLEEGDEIVIPQKSQVVLVNGEVLIPQAVIWGNGYSVRDYISKAGGFTDRANEDKIITVRANGETEIGYGVKVKPGDEIMILPEVKLNNLEVAGKVMEIIYKAAVAAAIPFKL